MIKKVFKEIERFVPDKHNGVLVANGERTKIMLLCLSIGAIVPPHSHPGYEVTLQPLKGKAKFPMGMNQEMLLQPGEFYFMDGETSIYLKNPFEENFQMLIHLVKK